MFEKTLLETLQRIFGVKKITYASPGEAQEQECLFIEVQKSRNTIKDGRQIAQVEGRCIMFGNADKLPFGFFSKRIDDASYEDTRNLFFHEFELNQKGIQNIVERSFSFVYFYDSQYDPDLGTITSITTEVS